MRGITTMMQHRFWGGAFGIALAFGLSSISSGQTQPAPEWSVITAVQIKPEFRKEMEGIHKEISAAYKKAGLSRVVVQTILGDLDEYISIAPLAKFADLDSPSLLSQPSTLSPQLLKRIGSYVISVHRTAYLAMNDISIHTDMANPGEYAHITMFHLAHGKGNAFAEYMKNEYLPAMRKADVANLWLSRPIFGGDLNDRVMVRPFHKLAEIDAGPLTTKALGREGAAQLAAKQNGIIESVHFTVVHVRPDLSNMPVPPEKAKTGE